MRLKFFPSHRGEKRVVSFAIVAVLGFWFGGAHAEVLDETVTFSDCVVAPLGRLAFLRALEIEMGLRDATSAPSDGALATPQRVEVAYDCEGNVELSFVWEERQSAHRVSLDDVPHSERVRALALVVAELLRSDPLGAIDAQREDAQTPLAQPNAPKPDTEVTQQHTTPDASWQDDDPWLSGEEHEAALGEQRLSFALAARSVWGSVVPLWGGSATLHFDRWWTAASVLGARAEARSEGVVAGVVSGWIMAMRVGYMAGSWTAAPCRLELHASLGAGLDWVEGSPRGRVSSQNVTSPYLEARLSTVTRFFFDHGRAIVVDINAGRSSGTLALAGGEAVIQTGGWFGGLELGAGF